MKDLFKFKYKNFIPCRAAERTYDYYNKKYFNGQLPTVHVGFYKGMEDYAWTIRLHGNKFATFICINQHFEMWSKVVDQNILHEMIHVKVFDNGHGKKFQKEKRRLLFAGAFDDLL